MKKWLGGAAGCSCLGLGLAGAGLVVVIVVVINLYLTYLAAIYAALMGSSNTPATIHGAPTNGVITATFHDPDYLARFGVEHEGLDIANDRGTPIYSTMDEAEVVAVGVASDYGVYIKLEDKASGWFTFYAHLLNTAVDVGDTVEWGEEIGRMDSTGNSTGNHLHYEIRTPDGERVDPEQSKDCCQ